MAAMKTLRLRDGKERSLLRRHPWIFDSAIARGGVITMTVVRQDSGAIPIARYAELAPRVARLRVEPTVLAERLRESAVRRPLLQDAQGKPLEGGALLRRIEKMLEERERYYEQADITLDIGSHSIDEVVEMTLEALKRHAERSH